jgi:predicted nucleotidyltransferase
MTTELANITSPQWADLCARWGIRRVEVFGSTSNGQATPDSDIDLLLTIEGGVTLLDWVELRESLAKLLGRPVDILSRSAVEVDTNASRRQAILQSARLIHESG